MALSTMCVYLCDISTQLRDGRKTSSQTKLEVLQLLSIADRLKATTSSKSNVHNKNLKPKRSSYNKSMNIEMFIVAV